MIGSDEKFLLIDLGLRIKTLRESKNLTQENLANDSDMAKSQITKIEKGKTNPTVKTLIRISNALGVEFKDLF